MARWSRRKFILDGAKFLPVGAGLSWLSRSSWADALSGAVATTGAEKHFFVFMQAYGGMHSPLGLDPVLPQNFPPNTAPNDIYLGKNASQIIDTRGVQQGCQIFLGPTAAPLAPFAGSCAIINGVYMAPGVAHPDSLLYVTTGNYKGNAGTLPAELWAATGKLGGIFVDQGLSLYPGKLKNLSVNSADYFASILTSPNDSPEVSATVPSNEDSSNLSPFDEAKLRYIEEGKKHVKFKNYFANLNKPQVDRSHAFLAAALQSEISTSAFLDLTGPRFTRIDSHVDHDINQISSQSEIWEQVAALFKLFRAIPFEGRSLFDSTTFMVVTEMSRTPFLNGNRGTDHNLYTNSVLIAGKGIQGGRVVGASRLLNSQQTGGESMHLAIPFDFKAGKVATREDQGRFIVPADVMKTVLRIFGVPEATMPGWTSGAQALLPIIKA